MFVPSVSMTDGPASGTESAPSRLAWRSKTTSGGFSRAKANLGRTKSRMGEWSLDLISTSLWHRQSPSLWDRCFAPAPAFPSLQDFGSGRVARGQSRPRSARNAAVSSTRSPLRRDHLTAVPFAGRSCARSVPRGERSSVSVAAEHHTLTHLVDQGGDRQ